jgi:hypothetical protein
MTCERIRTQLTAYLDGDLDSDGGTVVRGHLRTCEACRKTAGDEAALRDGLRALPPVDPPSTLWAGVQARLAQAEVEEAKRPAWRRTLARWGRWMPAPKFAVAGAVLAAATIGLIIWKTRGPVDEDQLVQNPPNHDDKVVHNPSPKFVPDMPKQQPPSSCKQIGEADDVTADLALDAARQSAAYDCAVEGLLAEIKQIRGEWDDRMRSQFDDQLKTLREMVAKADDGKSRNKANRALVAYLQKAATRDEVLLAGVP